MSFREAHALLIRFENILYLCKSIELVTILTLQMFKNKIVSARKVTRVIFCYFNEKCTEYFLHFTHLIIPFFTDKSCSGIINNSLWYRIKELLTFLAYKNIVVNFFGTSVKFRKNIKLHTAVRYVIGNLYKLSDETVSFYLSFILFRELVFLEKKYFFFFFNEYIHLYYQVVNYYLVRSLNEFMLLFFLNEYTFSLLDIDIISNLYFFFVSVILLDVISFNMYSELGSRANSMTNSIQSSKDNVKHYRLLYNRFRQARITNEIIEIISNL